MKSLTKQPALRARKMKDIELTNKLIGLLDKKAHETKNFPRQFTAKEVADELGGSYTRVGHVSTTVIAELRGRGIAICYDQNANTKKFVIGRCAA